MGLEQLIGAAGNAGQSWGNSASTSSGFNYGGSQSMNTAQSASNTYGTAASQYSDWQASQANQSALAAWREAAEYNSKEAQKQREWQERLANTQYQRSVADLKAAGLNPILAATNGISAASIGSGATASLGTPSSFMGSSFADQNSASTSYGSGSSWEQGGSSSQSYGYNASKWGIAEFAEEMGTLAQGLYDSISSSEVVQQATSALNQSQKTWGTYFMNERKQGTWLGKILNSFLGEPPKRPITSKGIQHN